MGICIYNSIILTGNKEVKLSFPKPFYRWRPHPWHGLSVGIDPPRIVNAYIEITPFDLVKYEVDKETGYLRVDRPQHTSSQPPTLYGFIPRTYCGENVGQLSPDKIMGDGDPLDICVLCERPIDKSEIILSVRVIGGIHMVDNGEADDKLIGVLASDLFWQDAKEIDDIPAVLVNRLRHYFNTYKLVPGSEPKSYITDIYNAERAMKVIEASIMDYNVTYGG